MKSRVIQTRFYDDEFVVETDLYTQHLYMYLLTCSYINLCGIFQLPKAKICFESKLSTEQLESALKNLADACKVFYVKGWVFVVNAQKNNAYTNSPLNVKPFKRELSVVPSKILETFESLSDNKLIPVSIPVCILDKNQKPKIKNKKPKTRDIDTSINSGMTSLRNSLVEKGVVGSHE